jgi:hypothetical protein
MIGELRLASLFIAQNEFSNVDPIVLDQRNGLGHVLNDSDAA